jgi:hypothetical protein
MLTAPIPWSTRFIALSTSVVLLVAVLWLVRRRKLREEYTPIWFVATLVPTAISLWPQTFLPITRALGGWSLASTAVFFALAFLVAICLSYAVHLSTLSMQIKNLSQQLALLRERTEGGPDD